MMLESIRPFCSSDTAATAAALRRRGQSDSPQASRRERPLAARATSGWKLLILAAALVASQRSSRLSRCFFSHSLHGVASSRSSSGSQLRRLQSFSGDRSRPTWTRRRAEDIEDIEDIESLEDAKAKKKATQAAAPAKEEEVVPETPPNPQLHGILRIQPVGSGRGSFLLNMGGTRVLVNPNLEGSDMRPETVHETVDCVLLTSSEDEFLHGPTLEKMDLKKVNFVAAKDAAEVVEQMGVRNLATINPGPGGKYLLTPTVDPGAAKLVILTLPGAGSQVPFGPVEQAFEFVNCVNGAAVGYEAKGLYLGPGGSTIRGGVPEEAWMIDYLITPDLREAASCYAGLANKGTVLKAVVRLPGDTADKGDPSNPMFLLDKKIDEVLGGIDDDPDEFRAFLKKQDAPMRDTELLMLEPNSRAVDLEDPLIPGMLAAPE